MSASRRGDLRASLAGAFLAGVTVSLVMGLPRSRAFGLLAVLLAGMATIYLGAALSTGRREHMLMEGLVAGAFVAFATLGVWGSPLFLVVGYLAHGLWDVAHYRSHIPTRIVAWWPPFCLVYDWVIAGAICLRWLHG
ncbi:MAG: hypothetical protein HYZ89_04790 [Candidatus Omnitrophica bacterium]|nr:hypothetical protein [Candidatus Omnitrophota bacterium]